MECWGDDVPEGKVTFFRGRCAEAHPLLQEDPRCRGVMTMRFKDSPERPPSGALLAGMDDRIMHARLRIAGAELMMSDDMRSGATHFDCLAVLLDRRERGRRRPHAFARTAVEVPPGPTFFAKRFGIVVDKFDVTWMILVTPDH